MDSLAFAFVDAVCQRLSGAMFFKFRQFEGLWSRVGATHEENRREYTLKMQADHCAKFSDSHYVNGEQFYHQECNRRPYRQRSSKEFIPKYDRIHSFTSIEISNEMKETSEFLERQLEYGNLESLIFIDLYKNEPWPESLAPLFKRFVQSPNFRILKLSRDQKVDFELASLFMNRWKSSTLKEGSVLGGRISFPENDLRAFYRNRKQVKTVYGYKSTWRTD